MRKTIFSLSAAVCLFFAGAARADVVYNLTLTPTTGGLIGSGTLDIATAPETGVNDVSTYKQKTGTLVGLTFDIGGDTFDLSDASGTLVQFTSGDLSDITYEGTFTDKVGKTKITISFQQNGLEYQFQDPTKDENSTGIITAALPGGSHAVGATPEPSSFILLGTALLSGAGVLRRRFV